MRQWEKNAKLLETLEKIDDNTDVIYMEIKMPFPFENRDMVQKRIAINNKKNPELIKKYGLPEKDVEYVIIQAQSVERSEKPEIKKITRANTVLSVCVMEKDTTVPNRIHIKMIVCNDIKMKVPHIMRNMMLKQMGKMMISTLTDAYKKIYKKK